MLSGAQRRRAEKLLYDCLVEAPNSAQDEFIQSAIPVVALALATAEREATERAAKVAEDFEAYTGLGQESDNGDLGAYARGNCYAKQQIAAAIRALPEPNRR